jgi:outer membrane protein OmpA-like peptidoglycan-associated protein
MFLVVLAAHSQKDYSLCKGNIVINPNTSYTLRFNGKIGKDKSGIQSYCNLPITANNFIWLYFTPSHNGQMSFETFTKEDSLLFFLFEVDLSEPCEAITTKEATMLSCDMRSSTAESLKVFPCKSSKGYLIALSVNKGKSPTVDFKLNYTPLNADGSIHMDSLILNLVRLKSEPILGFHVRDQLAKTPVIARFSFNAESAIDGTYLASDIYVNNTKRLRANIRIDAEGYFPKDYLDYEIKPLSRQDTFLLTPITHGSITKLDEIYFIGGLAVILDESLPRLKSLRDFLILNPSIDIEVQGHVNDDGNNSFSSQRLSKKRAKRIVEYLIKSGIESTRLSAVGFGNTKPIFPNPEDEDQKEANRRVEIKIK